MHRPRAFRRPRLLPAPIALVIALVCPSLAVGPARAQVRLADVPELARQRAERLRPAQVQALEPFWGDFALAYSSSQQVLDRRIDAAAQLGDSVVPLLLEKLQPAQDTPIARNIAANCRRVLERLDPGSFVDALAELAGGSNDIARHEAIRLLGHAQVPQAARVLTDLFDRTKDEDRRLVIRSLKLLRHAGAAPKVAPMLASSDRQVREEALSYLIAARAGNVVDTVVAALSQENDPRLLPSYIDYFAACARGHEQAALALLRLLDRNKLEWQDTRSLVAALATVAPHDHEPTCRRLQQMIDGSDTSSLAVQVAVTLRALGDKQGVTRLKRTLDEQLRRPQRRREPALYEQRANLLFAIGDYGEAADDYQKIIEYTEGPVMTRRAYVGLIACEARRRRISNLIRQLKASGMTVAEIEALGQGDDVVQEILQHERVRTFLQVLAKEQAPR
jgi:tetratricopeptide (TPR) repeat protein